MSNIQPFAFFGTDSVSEQALQALKAVSLIPDLVINKMVDDTIIATLLEKKYQFAILMSYGRIMPKKVLELFPMGIINIHPSLLPTLRGPSPIKSAILDNLEQTGVSIMLLDNEVDHGPIIAQSKSDADLSKVTSHELTDILLEQGARLLSSVLPDYLSGALIPIEQDPTNTTYSKKFYTEDALLPYLDWTNKNKALLFERKVRALNPEPGTHSHIPTERGVRRVKILKSNIVQGIFTPLIVQPAGKKPMSWDSFLKGNPIKP